MGDYYGINCDIKVNDGQLHTLRLVKKANLLSMQLDSFDKIQQIINKDLQELDNQQSIYVGGRIKEFHDGKSGFRGCLYQLILDNKEINFDENNVNTANIVPCQE